MFWKKKKVDTIQDSKIVLGMVMLNGDNSFDSDSFLSDFKNNYGGNIKEPTGDNASFVVKVDGMLDTAWGFLYSSDSLRMASAWFMFNGNSVRYTKDVNQYWKKVAIK